MFKAFSEATNRKNPPKDLDEVCQIYSKFASDNLVDDGQVGLYAIIGMKNNDGTTANLMCPMYGDMAENRRKVLFELGKKFSVDSLMGYFTSIEYVGIVSEAWASVFHKDSEKGKQILEGKESIDLLPINDPNKREVVIVMFTDGKKLSEKISEIHRVFNPELNRVVVSLEEKSLRDIASGNSVEDRTPEQIQIDQEKSLKSSVLWSFHEAYNKRDSIYEAMPKDVKEVADRVRIKNLNNKINYAQFQKEREQRTGKKARRYGASLS